MHVNASQVQLYLETDIDIGSINCRRPPKGKSTVGNLVETRSLSICQFLIFHTFFEATCLLPKQALPSREVGTFEQGVFKNTLNTTQSLNHVSSIVVQVPQLTIVLLVTPPERVLFQNLVLLEVLSDTPAFIVSKRESVFLEQCVYARNTAVPAIFEIIQSKTTVLS